MGIMNHDGKTNNMKKKQEPVKVDKRSKQYRDSLKKLPAINNVVKAKLQKEFPHILIKSSSEPAKLSQQGYEQKAPQPKSHYEMIIELQDWCRGMDERIKELSELLHNIETKVG